ncbi:MAG: helicase-related protein [bacterium]
MGNRSNPANGQRLSPSGSGSLRRHAWRRFLRGPDPSLLDGLYVPALAEAVRYDRCCAYFSSTALAAAARGFGALIERLEAMGEKAPRPSVRLVVNEEMEEEDVRAMMEKGDLSRLEEKLRRRFKTPKDVLEKARLAMLGWLVKKGLLEVRVGVMRRGEGIVHAKFGVVTDGAGEAIVFSGSSNESAQGLLGNYERLEVSTSWDDPERYQEYAGEFEALWGDIHPDVHTVPLPEALRLRLIKFAPTKAPTVEPSNALARQKAAMIWQFICEAPYLPHGDSACDETAMVDLWPHQGHVVEETARAWPEGRLLCDEVGMGKTIEAILVLRRLMAGRGVRRALILLPAGLLRQWQSELREKGGMVFPRLEGTNALIWPDDRVEKVNGIAEALERDALLMSRETARTENNLPLILSAKSWDLVLLDEAHAARRRKQEEGEFNSGTLLLDLLRQLQLRRKTRGILLLSATPMQTHPWEPWDLLAVLGEGGLWLSDFNWIRDFYTAVAAVGRGSCDLSLARRVAETIAADPCFPPLDGEGPLARDKNELARRLAFVPPTKREPLAQWLRTGSPLARRMHRNTRNTLSHYYERGLLPSPPPRRGIQDIVFDYQDQEEREIYNAVSRYIEKRFDELESERPGKGFVMTVYRRRASSSPLALERSLGRRREALRTISERRAYDVDLSASDVPEGLSEEDLPEEATEAKVSAALPQDPQVARRELAEIESLLDHLRSLQGRDTKRDRFFDALRRITEDGRSVLIFTEYVDTLEYLREALVEFYRGSLGCYSGAGGKRWDGVAWQSVTKDAITRALASGELRALVCTDAASEGLNLQAAGALINYDLPWNPSKVEQRIGRIDRIGQRLPEIRVINLFLHNSVDEKVYQALRRRCGLFEHFVGSMQPVLARARRMLLGQEELDTARIEAAASEIEGDPLPGEIYLEGRAVAHGKGGSVLSRAQIEASLSYLKEEFGFRVRGDRRDRSYLVSGPGISKALFTSSVEVLEHDAAARPLSPLEPRIHELVTSLSRPGEHLPLAIGTYQSVAFRRSVVYWVSEDKIEPIESFEDLKGRVDSWNGDYPDPGHWLGAQKRRSKRLRNKSESSSRRPFVGRRMD